MSKGKWIAGGIVALVVIGAAAGGNDDTSKPKADKPAVVQSETPKAADKPKATSKPKAAEKSPEQQFAAYVTKHGTPSEVEAVKHVTKVQGGDEINNILDTADVYTDYSGGMFGPHGNDGKLIASAFADWQQSRGKSSDNGLVTVYDKDAETLSNGKF
ncbi:hypothetical protein ACKI1K_15050 [Streptomyces scabiei]|uniref:hypothetical protein n=1 Tax=Streptomyces scabiei TaxID=1930 RepID=UPI0038F5E735